MPERSPPPLDPEGLVDALARREVDYVLVGAFAAVLHGSPLPTQDIDICPAQDDANASRLASFLLVDALARWETTGFPFAATLDEAAARLSSGNVFSFETRFGRLDVLWEPAGTKGYRDLRRDAVAYELGNHHVLIASLRDIIRSKESAGRAEDLRALPTLRKLLERREGRPPIT